MKRPRGRNRKPNHSPNRSLESNGPDVKIRGSASHINEKYLNLARDASSSGDRVKAENYFQHAEHYYRIVQEQFAKQRERQEQEAQAREQRQQHQQQQQGRSTHANDGAGDQPAVKSSNAGPLDVVAQDSGTPVNGGGAAAEDAPKPKRTRRPRRPRQTEAKEPAAPSADADAAE